jgi:hypothetical protein
VREPHEATPLQGTWIGAKSDHLSTKIAVKVVAAADAETGRGTGVARES